MKDKRLLWICFLLVVINSVGGCRKKSTPSPQQSVQQTEVSNQDGIEQVAPDKSATEKLLVQESVSAIDVSEAQGEEIEYFALLMEGKKWVMPSKGVMLKVIKLRRPWSLRLP